MVYFFYHFDYEVLDPSLSDDTDGPYGDEEKCPSLVIHAKVYALAEKFLIPGLKALAIRKYKAAASASLGIDDFLQSVQEVYTSTVESDRGLRDAVVKLIYDHPVWLDEKKVQDVAKELGAWMYDLVVYIRQHGGFLKTGGPFGIR